MKTKNIFQGLVIIAILISSFASPSSALARSKCANYIVVQWGDTLSGLAAYCNTTMTAIRAANPGLGWWLYAGQVLYIPSGSNYSPAPAPTTGNYTVRWGDTLGTIAAAYGVSLNALITANTQIWNPNLIFPGQVIKIPASSYVPPPPPPPPYVPPPVITPVPAPANFDGTLTVIAIEGVNVRDQPRYTGKIVLRDDFTKGRTFSYRKNSVTKDETYRRVWVEVIISQTSSGYTTGWLPVSGPQDFLKHTGPIQDWVTPHIE